MVRILSLPDGISYFPHGKSEMLRRKSEMLREIWHFLRGKREMPHGFCGLRVENAKCCAEFGIFCAENGKTARILRSSAWKMPNAARNSQFPHGKSESLRRILDFLRGKGEIPIRLSNLEFSGSKVPFACISARCPISKIRRRNG